MSYEGEIPDGASGFEQDFGLAPLHDDSARLARIENLLGIFVRAAMDPSSDRAKVWVGSFAPTQVEVPVPDAAVLEAGLAAFRSPEEVAARVETAALYPDVNAEG